MSNESRLFPRLAASTGAFAFCFLVVFLLYRTMAPQILSAETGVNIVLGYTAPANQRSWVAKFWRSSSNGHYMPFALSAEFLFSKFAGTNESLWRYRQLFGGGVIAFGVMGLFRAAAREHTLAATILAAAAAALLTTPPIFGELLAWPFHIFQMLWLALALGVAWSFVELPGAQNPKRQLWLIAVLAYASMHVLGLGAATVAATLATFFLMLARPLPPNLFKIGPRSLILVTVTLAVAGAIHGWLMIALDHADKSVPLMHHVEWQRALGLVVFTPISALAELAGGSLDSTRIDQVLYSAWPLSAAFVLTLGLTIFLLARRADIHFAALALLTFSGVLLLALVAMIVLRERAAPSPSYFGYLAAPRYHLPLALPWLGFAAAALTVVAPRRLPLFAALISLFAAGGIAAHAVYQKEVVPLVTPLHGASQSQLWRDLFQLAREARAAHLPIPNLPLQQMAGFPFQDFKFYDPVLQHELGTTAPDQFLEWSECRGPRLQEYLTACPTLRPTAKLLDIDLKDRR